MISIQSIFSRQPTEHGQGLRRVVAALLGTCPCAVGWRAAQFAGDRCRAACGDTREAHVPSPVSANRLRPIVALFSLSLLIAFSPGLSATPTAVNVGASEFTLFWESEVAGEPEVRVFSDAGGADEITADLRREAFPLAAPLSPYATGAERLAAADFKDSIGGRGLMTVRVSGASPDTAYFVEAGVRDDGGTFHAAKDGLVEVHTAASTPFVADFRIAAFTFEDTAESGSIAVLSAPGARSPLLAVVGDASGGLPHAVFPLGDLVDDATGEPMPLDGTLSFEVSHYRGVDDRALMADAVMTDGGFRVAALTTRAFEMAVDVDVAYFQFDAVDDQMAGQPFMVRVTARTDEGAIASDFGGTVTLDSDGRLEAGESTAAFAAGVLEDHEVVIGNTGDFRLFATTTAVAATGESNVFRVSTDWENYASLFGDPAAETRREQRLADPEGTGLPALMRYGFDLAPGAAGLGDAFEVDETVDGDERYASITFRRLQYAPDVRYIVHGTSDLNGWETLAVVEPGTPEWVTVEDGVPLANSGDGRFLRVGVVGDGVYEYWRVGEFDPAQIDDPSVSGPDADPGNLGIDNRTRYALGMSGIDPDLGLLPSRTVVTENGESYYRLDFNRLPLAEDILYVVEATSDYPNWDEIAVIEPGEPVEVSVVDSTPIPDQGYRIIRMRIEPVPEP